MIIVMMMIIMRVQWALRVCGIDRAKVCWWRTGCTARKASTNLFRHSTSNISSLCRLRRNI